MKLRFDYEILRKGGAHDDNRRKPEYDPFEWMDELGIDSSPVMWTGVKWGRDGEEDGREDL
jgi:hypothetical protein